MSWQPAQEIDRALAVKADLRAILAAMSDAVIAADAGGQLTFMNPSAEALTGWPEEQAKGRALAEIFRCPRPGVLLTRNHTPILIEERATPLAGDSAGGVVLVFRRMPLREVSWSNPGGALAKARFERAAAVATARAERLQEVTAACSEARAPGDVAAVVVSRGCAALGATRALLYLLTDDGAALELVEVRDYPPEAVEALRRSSMEHDAPLPDAIRTGTALFFETADAVLGRYPHLAGALQPGDNALAVLPLVVDGRALGALGFIFDENHVFDAAERTFIVALAHQCAQALDRARLYEVAARARAAAETANRAKDDFLATLSHELRTPLTAIVGWASILRTRPPEPARLGRALQTIERNAHTLVQLIEDILDVSRIVAGKLRLELQLVDPAAVVRAAIDMVRPSAEAKQIALETVIDDEIGTLAADPARLQQIALNLLSNAVKFTGRGGRIEVRLSRIDAGVQLQVIDGGEGIDPAFLPRVFERFGQADSSNTRAHGGLGLGLAIVKHLAEQHHGAITAESGGLGLGATFTVTLPAATPDADELGRPRVVKSALPPSPRLDGIRVLLVDDEPDARELLAIILQEQGASVETAASAQEAIRAVERARPDVIVSDIGMPHEDGYSLLKRLRARDAERGAPLPALALTAYAGVHDVKMAELAGFQRHLTKPVLPAQVIEAIARLARGA